MTTVAIRGQLPSYRSGLVAALGARGLEVADEPADVVVVGFDPERCGELVEAAQAGTVVALVDRLTAGAAAHALRHGVTAVADRAADPAEIAAIVELASRGSSPLPVAVARTLADEWPDPHAPHPDVTAEEVSWIAALAHGTTVARLADDFGFSERAMFRKLHDLYGRLGAANRAEAIVAATRLGIGRQ